MDIEKVLTEMETRHNNYETMHGLYCDICGDIKMTCGPLSLVHEYKKLQYDKVRDAKEVERLRTDLAAQNHVLCVAEAHRDELIEDIEEFEEDVERLIFVWQFVRDSLDAPDVVKELLTLFGNSASPMAIEDMRFSINAMLTKMKTEELII